MPPNSALGEALGYATRQRAKLVFFLDHAEVPIHNSFVKRQIEQYALGQKLWMFCYDKAWRQASADLFPLVMTARADGSEPFEGCDRGAAAVELQDSHGCTAQWLKAFGRPDMNRWLLTIFGASEVGRPT